MDELEPGPQILAPCARGRSIGVLGSPEFEFCSSFPQSDLVCAADLFSDGVILPLHRQHRMSNDILPTPPTDPEPSWFDRRPPEPEIHAAESARLSASTTAHSSMRWMNIFKKNDKKPSRRSIDLDAEKDIISAFREMTKKRERRNSCGGGGSGGATPAELNINIWPFARSRSAGNGGSRAPPPRKVSSAPCSRSNSSGDSKSRRWPVSPGRGGIPIGRSSPVWQARRGGGGRRSSDGNEGRRKIPLPGGGGGKGKVSSSNGTGKREQLSCRIEESSVTGGGVARGGGGRVLGEGTRGSSLFNIKSLFTKKVY